jgi:RecB family exonuclease
VHSAEQRAFLAAATAWSRSGDERHAARLLRSPFSGVPYEVGAAYVALSVREGSLLELIDRERIAVDTSERDALIAFKAALRDPSELARLCERPGAPLPASLDDDEAFALCEAVFPEPETGITTNNPRFSASQLNTYVECPRKWYYRYLCAAVEDKGSSASYYGTAFHAALEDLHQEYPRPSEADPQELDRKLQGYVNAAFDRFRGSFDTPVEHELQVRRARRTARKYVQWLVNEGRHSPFTIVGCELAAELQIEGYDFIGYIDRLDRDDRTGSVSVLDYKTGSIATTAAEYREKVRQFKDFQLPFYYWARTAEGDRVWRLALIPLKDALLDVRPIVLEVVPIAADIARSQSATGVIPLVELERARSRMIEICRELTSGSLRSLPTTDDPAACAYCAYQISCAGRPYPEEERFGR